MDFDNIKTSNNKTHVVPTNTLHPNTPQVFSFFVEYTLYPSSGRMFQSKCVPMGRKYKKQEAPKVKEQIKLEETKTTKKAW